MNMNVIIIVIAIFGLVIGFIIGIFWLEVRISLVILGLRNRIKEELCVLEFQGSKNLENISRKIDEVVFSSYRKIMNYIANFLLFCILILFVFFSIFLIYFK
ncbi:MAG: hypothetical protein ACO2O4_00415 [Minisyncoccia bacterium]